MRRKRSDGWIGISDIVGEEKLDPSRVNRSDWGGILDDETWRQLYWIIADSRGRSEGVGAWLGHNEAYTFVKNCISNRNDVEFRPPPIGKSAWTTCTGHG